MASTLRNITQSVLYRVFHILRQKGWYAIKTGVPLTLITTTIDPAVPPKTYGVINGRAWVFFDDDAEVSTNGLTVKVSGTLQDPSTYSVDYRRARVTFNSAPSGAVTVDAYVYTTHVLDAYPSTDQLNTLELPIVSIWMKGQDSEAFGIGTNSGMYTQTFFIDILSRNDAERIDLGDQLQKLLLKIGLVDMSLHQPLKFNGDIDPEYSFEAQISEWLRHIRRPDLKSLEPRRGGSDKEKFRSLLTMYTQNIE